MSRSYRFTFDIDPVAKGRPRVSFKGKYSSIYTPLETRQFEQSIRMLLKGQWNKKPLTGPLIVRVSSYIERPESESSKYKTAKHHTKKPDSDNLAKSLIDACNKILWNDDAQITSLRTAKFWADDRKPSISLSVYELQE